MIDRKKELNELLKKLRKVDTNNNTDIDLILEYLETAFAGNFKNEREISKKFVGIEIENDNLSLSRLYHLTWRQTLLEVINNKI